MSDLRTLAAQTTFLVVIPDTVLRSQVVTALEGIGTIVTAKNTAEAEATLSQEPFSVLIAQDEQAEESGVMFFARINHRHPWMRRILICHRPEPELLVFLINEANVFRCATLPLDPATFRQLAIRAAEDHVRLRSLTQSAADGERWRDEQSQVSFHASRRPTSLRQWIRTLPAAFSVTLITSLWVLLLGTVVLLLLYFLKSALGIDFIEGMHLSDLFR